MKKMYLLLIILNNLASFILISSYLLLNINTLNILIVIGVFLLYLSITIAIIKRSRIITGLDIFTISIYMLFIIFIFLYSMIYQKENVYTYNLSYFSELLFIPNILFNVYNLFKIKREENQ